MAALEARHTSPLSGDVTVLVRRLKPWGFNQSGEFVAIYLRAGEARAEEGFDVEVQGKRLRIELPSPAAREAAIRERVWQAASGVIILIGIAGLGVLAWQRHTVMETRLAEAELRVTRAAHAAKVLSRDKSEATALGVLDLKGQGADQVLHDLSLVTAAKASDARIDAFYWRRGYWAVEAHGDAAPIDAADGNLQRSTKPVRRDVWLWVSHEDGQSEEKAK